MKVLNAFSLNMVQSFPAAIAVNEITREEARARLADGFESAIGHADSATVFGRELGIEIPANRATVTLAPGEVALVIQYTGPRLPEGCTTLPEGAKLKYLEVTVS